LRKEAFDESFQLLSREQQRLWGEISGSGSSGGPSLQGDEIAKRSLIIPTIEELKNPPSKGAFGPSTALTETTAHPPLGDAYLVLTDHTDALALSALERLASHRNGRVIHVENLGILHELPNQFDELRETLIRANPRYVAISPRPENYRENLHLSMLKLLTSLDNDAELDAFPGYLFTETAEDLAALVDRTIDFEPLSKATLKPAMIGAIEDDNSLRYRSYQKAKVLQKHLDSEGIKSLSIIITTRRSHTRRSDFPISKYGDQETIAMHPTSEQHTFDTLSPKAASVLNRNNLLYMFGHGTVGRIVGTRTKAFDEIDFTNEIVFCGSCMSATPIHSDRLSNSARKPETPRFAQVALRNGAVVVLGHLGLCGGFPKVYPMSELVLEGKTAGEAYQQLMNGIIGQRSLPSYFANPTTSGRGNLQGGANNYLYILFGDPALAPIQL
ncbi:MAG: hypothetical protein AAGH89_00470, partial [Verrucomicrobiota bacterium]